MATPIPATIGKVILVVALPPMSIIVSPALLIRFANKLALSAAAAICGVILPIDLFNRLKSVVNLACSPCKAWYLFRAFSVCSELTPNCFVLSTIAFFCCSKALLTLVNEALREACLDNCA